MGRKKVEVNPESGKRLLTWLKRIDMTQGELASVTGYTQQHISAIITGKKYLNYDFACLVSKKTVQNNPAFHPPTFSVRPEWLICQDNKGMTDIEAFDNALDKMIDFSSATEEVIAMTVENLGYSLRLLFEDDLPEAALNGRGGLHSAYYGIIQSGQVVGLVPLGDMSTLRTEISHYVEFLISKALNEYTKDHLINFPEPTEV